MHFTMEIAYARNFRQEVSDVVDLCLGRAKLAHRRDFKSIGASHVRKKSISLFPLNKHGGPTNVDGTRI